MVPIALNYNSLAVVHATGSCAFAVGFCTDSTALRYDSSATDDDGSCVPRVSGCMLPSAANYDSAATVTAPGGCVVTVLGCTDSTARNYWSAATVDGGNCEAHAPGCTARVAANYDSAARDDDGSCVFTILGCSDPAAANYRSDATEAAPCEYKLPGCTDPTAANFDSAAAADDGSCAYVRFGCTDTAAAYFDPLATDADAALCSYEGCTDSRATNYEAIATVDDGRCVLRRASVQVATFGYMQRCLAFVDGDNDGAHDAGAEPSSRSDVATGFASVIVYGGDDAAPLVVGQSTIDDPCTDQVIGSTLPLPLFTDVAADIATPLTSVAHFLRAEHGASLSGASETLRTALALPRSSVWSYDAFLGFFSGPSWEREAAGRWLSAQMQVLQAVACSAAFPPLAQAARGGNVGRVARALYATLARLVDAATDDIPGGDRLIYGGGDSGYPPLRLATNMTLLRCVHGAARGSICPTSTRKQRCATPTAAGPTW